MLRAARRSRQAGERRQERAGAGRQEGAERGGGGRIRQEGAGKERAVCRAGASRRGQECSTSGREKLTEPTRLWYSDPSPRVLSPVWPCHAGSHPCGSFFSASVSPPRWEARDPSHQPDRTCPLWAGTGPCRAATTEHPAAPQGSHTTAPGPSWSPLTRARATLTVKVRGCQALSESIYSRCVPN